MEWVAEILIKGAVGLMGRADDGLDLAELGSWIPDIGPSLDYKSRPYLPQINSLSRE